ncbi:MAG TPA: lipase family protein [Streptosporangiaceae bacterium]|nr:lipase family protein [Streptosporangiaceae bacterium]
MRVRIRSTAVTVAAAALAVTGLAVTAGPVARAATGPALGSFYSYTGRTPLAKVPPGTVLKTRTLSYHVVGIPLPVQVVQLQYRSAGSLGQPAVNVTSVLEPPVPLSSPKAVSYQSFYDSLNPADEPSVQIAGDVTLGGLITDAESIVIAPLLLQGYTVIVPDTEGQKADFSAGPEYGINTLNSIRAADSSPLTGLSASTPTGMFGYSGGAIATDWAAQLAPGYAPDVNRQLVGAAEGGILVDPAHNLNYISGSLVWAGVMPMAVIGIARGYHINLTPYLSSYGRQLDSKLQDASIANALGQYPGLTYAQLVKPKYANPASIPILVKVENKLDAGLASPPTVPMFMGQGADGILEGTPGNKPGIGPGDGVMIAGDVRTLARGFCADGTAVDYTQYDLLSHVTTFPAWAPAALTWLNSRFAGTQAPNDCASIAPGNSLARIHPAG